MQKVNFKKLPSIMSVLSLAFMLTFSTTIFAQDAATEAAPAEAATPAAEGVGDAEAGEALFKANCASCHNLYKKRTGPALFGVGDKYESAWLYEWIRNSAGLIASGDARANAIYEEFNKSPMTAFPGLSNTDIDNIIAYTYTEKQVPVGTEVTTETDGGTGGGVSNNIILGALALVFLLLVTMLFLVTNTLKKIASANGVEYPTKNPNRTPVWKVFVENQFLVLVSAVFLLLASAYFMYGFFMQVGVDQGYAPVQPIHYSHRIHAGSNEIDCNYCHSSARKCKHSGIPSLNVCMNCHKSIGEVAE